MLIADHREAIEGERKRLRRLVRTRSAILYGLAKRLATLRRLLFVVAFVWFYICLFGLATREIGIRGWPLVEMAACFMLMTVLLAMELIDKIKYRDELELARDLQADLIPKQPAQTPQYDVAAFNEIANTVGGDIYDFVAITAGHPEILKIDRAGKVVDRLGKGSYPLGIKTTLSWQEIRDTLQCGERLLLHSDGLTEARNRTGHEFGDSYVEAIVSWN